NRCHRQNMKTSIINGSEVSRLSVAIHLSQLQVPPCACLNCFPSARQNARNLAIWAGSGSLSSFIPGDRCSLVVISFSGEIWLPIRLKPFQTFETKA
ncbi:hypothetical protein, partial [Pantoea sp. YU22]|uniref:hypothetical protein n=1 Tax=Pantoea sp. YU22 TaxID=2497684 RepID=UPI0028933EB4